MSQGFDLKGSYYSYRNKETIPSVFIHGVGEGVLKLELEYVLKRYEDLTYYDADYQKYGFGATEVCLNHH